MHLTLTPDGALVDTECVSGTNKFGVLWPLFEFDGRNVLNKNIAKFHRFDLLPAHGWARRASFRPGKRQDLAA